MSASLVDFSDPSVQWVPVSRPFPTGVVDSIYQIVCEKWVSP